ncbi:MAG TPA: GNAT family N-acetyltransferase [Rhizomicrobium sp.]|nr:GNAT family N-acetyltransferase [Rhizomicrobium sp.]
MGVPVLETERLILRGHELADFPAYAEMWADPGVTRYTSGAPLSQEEAWGKFLRTAGMWNVMGFGYWSVTERASGRRIGELGFLEGKRDITPPLAGTPECGWALVPSVHGKGFASEALRAALGWGDDHFGKVRMACMIAPENAPSLKLAAKFGFREAHRTLYKGEPTIVLYRDP